VIKKTAKEKHSIYQSSFYRYKKRQSPLKWIILLTVVLSIFLYVNPVKGSDYQKAKRFSPNDVKAGHLLLNNPDIPHDKSGMKSYQSAVLLNSAADFEINGLIATVTLTQAFMNQTDQLLHGTYAFPLPENSAVSYMHIQVGNRLIEGSIMEKKQAKRVFNQAKRRGRKASLVEQQRPNLFTNNIANIPANEQITVTIKYVQQVTFKGGQFSLRFPMTYTPRYQSPNPEVEKGSLSLPNVFLDDDSAKRNGIVDYKHIVNGEYSSEEVSKQNFVISSQNMPLDIKLSVALAAGVSLSSVSSESHPLSLARQNKGNRLASSHSLVDLPSEQQTIKLGVGNVTVAMDKDFTLTWQPSPNTMPQLSIFSQEVNQEHFMLAMLLPPSQSSQAEQLVSTDALFARDITFIIDTSGSMQGQSIKQAKAGLSFALSTLNEKDSFNIIAFNSTFQQAFPSTVMVNATHINSAQRFIDNLRANGGTEMYRPLQAAIEMPLAQAQSNEAIRQVVFLTDGAVSGEQALFKLIKTAPHLPRLFTVGIGSAPNGYFMRKAAQFGQGSYTYIADVNHVAKKMSNLLNKISQPVLKNIKAQFNPLHLGALEQYPEKIPDLYYGEPLLIAFKTQQVLSSIELFGDLASNGWYQEHQFQRSDKLTQQQGISTVWARAKIADLLDGLVIGKPLAEVKPKVIETSIAHQIMSPYTSFIAVEKERLPVRELVKESTKTISDDKNPLLAKQLLARKKVVTKQQSVSTPFPKTALGWQKQLSVGVLLLAFALVLVRLKQRNKLIVKLWSIVAIGVGLIAVIAISMSLWIPTKALLAGHLIERSWKNYVNEQVMKPPWPWADTVAVAKLQVPRLEQSLVLLKGIDPTSLAFSAGVMHRFSTFDGLSPIVAAGHRDTHFAFLEQIQLADIISLTNAHGDKFLYQVETLTVVNSKEAHFSLDIHQADLFLITCYPFNALQTGGDLRYVVKAKRLNE